MVSKGLCSPIKKPLKRNFIFLNGTINFLRHRSMYNDIFYKKKYWTIYSEKLFFKKIFTFKFVYFLNY